MFQEPPRTLIPLLDNMFNKPDLKLIDSIFAPDFVAHVPMMPVLDRNGFRSFIQSFYEAFPDFRQEINESVIAGGWLILRVTYHGKQQGDFLGIPATGCEVSMCGMSMFRIENDWIIEGWTELDIFGVLSQISHEMALPVDAHSSSLN